MRPIDIVFVSDWVNSSLAFAWYGPAADFFSGLASFSRLILFDKRETGLSDRSVGVPDLEARMDDVRAVLDAVGSKRTALVGVGEGGGLAALFAATYPERTAALVLYGSAAAVSGTEDITWEPTKEELQRQIDERAERTVLGWELWMNNTFEWVAPSFAGNDPVSRWWKMLLQLSTSPGSFMNFARALHLGYDVRGVLPTIRVPTLVLQRAGDRAFEVRHGRYLAERILGSEYVELPGEVHRHRRLHVQGRRVRRPGLGRALATSPRAHPTTARALPGPRA